MNRGVKQIQAEIDKALSEYGKAVNSGDVKRQEQINNKIKDLVVEREWVML